MVRAARFLAPGSSFEGARARQRSEATRSDDVLDQAKEVRERERERERRCAKTLNHAAQGRGVPTDQLLGGCACQLLMSSGPSRATPFATAA